MLLLILPNQLFAKHPGLRKKPTKVALLEDSLFFGDPTYPASFHKQKLWFHRSTMKRYEADLQDKGHLTEYCDYDSKSGSLKRHLKRLAKQAHGEIAIVEPNDFIFEKRLNSICDELKLRCNYLSTPMWMNTPKENSEYRAGKKRWFMADFYKWQRQRFDILMDGDEPQGGKWSFDDDNRKKVPKKLLSEIPAAPEVKHDDVDEEAVRWVEKQFPDNPGRLDHLYYPTNHRAARRWLKQFLEQRFTRFGDYEDAIVEGESWLWHSVLTPMLNTGLLTPKEIIDATVKHCESHEVPLNASEGFIRQVIGWREFMRATYQDLGVQMRTTNHWNHHRPLANCFYDGSTGIAPVDDCIHRILDTGYCHHIERLMVLGGFMFLCEFDPDEIYRWFMEMFIDSYDWVMVPNVYAMSQNADGGLITTKPYFSGSSYVRKQSHYKPGPWCDIWDGLYWRWIFNHTDELEKNPRWAMMCAMGKKMDKEKRRTHVKNAEKFLKGLS